MARAALRYVQHRITQHPDTDVTFEAECLSHGCGWAATPSPDGAAVDLECMRHTGRSADALRDTARREQVQAYEDPCEKHGLEPGEVGLAWLLTRPGVTGPIVGPRTTAQLASALRAVELDLSAEFLSEVDAVFPGPGPSPEAFAW